MSIENEPHVIAFVGVNGRLYPCVASSNTPGTIDVHCAIYPDRATADANRHLWNTNEDGAGYFSVPASALFHVEKIVPPPVYKFTLKFDRYGS